MLLGCSAGFLNVAAIKGSHTAIKSGIEAAQAIVDAKEDEVEIKGYQTRMDESWAVKELYNTRNFTGGFKYGGLIPGTIVGGLTTLITRGMEPFTFPGKKVKDCDATSKAKDCKEIKYPKPDGILSFDLLTNLQRSGTTHEADQEAHLRIKPEKSMVAAKTSLEEFAGPESRFCPAKVYEYHEGKLVINAQNCLHCKACSIKTPEEFIKWTVPEGGGGPKYTMS
jgi:electron-transferring-flavoprotein dehydrogenase